MRRPITPRIRMIMMAACCNLELEVMEVEVSRRRKRLKSSNMKPMMMLQRQHWHSVMITARMPHVNQARRPLRRDMHPARKIRHAAGAREYILSARSAQTATDDKSFDVGKMAKEMRPCFFHNPGNNYACNGMGR